MTKVEIGLQVRADVAAYLDMLAQSGMPPINRVGVVAAREMMLAGRMMGDVEPTPLAVVRDLVFDGPGGGVAVRLYDRRARRDQSPVIVFFHGGGFVIGDLDSHEPFCSYLADQMDLPVLAVDYRLAPEHRFPAAADDAEAAARWVAQSPEALGFAVTGLITCGDSAGGNLVLVTGHALVARPAAVPLIAQLAIYPYVGGGKDWPSMRECGEGFMLTEEAMDWFDEEYAASGDDPRHACIAHDPAGMPPLLVVTAGLDPLRDQGRAYAAKARQAGCVVRHIEAEGVIHGFVCLRRAIPSSQGDIDRLITEAKALLASGVADG